MKWRRITILVLMVNTFCFGQEICNNAIDDDGDGQIDINDSECVCNTTNANNNLVGLIPNASFEDYNNCPWGPSQLNNAQNWVQCTTTTADYMNTCGYVFEAVETAGLSQFPDGNGIAGIIITKNFKEYIGTDLTAPIQAGKSYTISFYIASVPVNGDGDTCNGGVINYSPLNITLYGSANGGTFPINTEGAPTANSQWGVLGSSLYQPVSSWGLFSITFTPSVNINSIIIGAPESLPSNYDNNTCYPYFLFDGLSISEASDLTASITPSGGFCEGNMTLHANTNLDVAASTTYQWYKDGVAISNATGVQLNTDTSGTYIVKITSNNHCVLSSPYTVAPNMQYTAPEMPQTESLITYNYNDYALPLYAQGENLTWYDAEGNMLPGTPIPQTEATGSTVYYVTQTIGNCESDKAMVIVQVIAKEVTIKYPKFFTPNGDGVHEYWNISPMNDESEAEIYIYDRNGKFITQLSSHDSGWNGTLNGQNLPANDYWFKVLYKEYGVQKEFMSHFSLVR